MADPPVGLEWARQRLLSELPDPERYHIVEDPPPKEPTDFRKLREILFLILSDRYKKLCPTEYDGIREREYVENLSEIDLLDHEEILLHFDANRAALLAVPRNIMHYHRATEVIALHAWPGPEPVFTQEDWIIELASPYIVRKVVDEFNVPIAMPGVWLRAVARPGGASVASPKKKLKPKVFRKKEWPSETKLLKIAAKQAREKARNGSILDFDPEYRELGAPEDLYDADGDYITEDFSYARILESDFDHILSAPFGGFGSIHDNDPGDDSDQIPSDDEIPIGNNALNQVYQTGLPRPLIPTSFLFPPTAMPPLIGDTGSNPPSVSHINPALLARLVPLTTRSNGIAIVNQASQPPQIATSSSQAPAVDQSGAVSNDDNTNQASQTPQITTGSTQAPEVAQSAAVSNDDNTNQASQAPQIATGGSQAPAVDQSDEVNAGEIDAVGVDAAGVDAGGVDDDEPSDDEPEDDGSDYAESDYDESDEDKPSPPRGSRQSKAKTRASSSSKAKRKRDEDSENDSGADRGPPPKKSRVTKGSLGSRSQPTSTRDIEGGLRPTTKKSGAGTRSTSSGHKRPRTNDSESDPRPPKKPRAGKGSSVPPSKPSSNKDSGHKRPRTNDSESDPRPPKKPRAGKGSRVPPSKPPNKKDSGDSEDSEDSESDHRPKKKPQAGKGSRVPPSKPPSKKDYEDSEDSEDAFRPRPLADNRPNLSRYHLPPTEDADDEDGEPQAWAPQRARRGGKGTLNGNSPPFAPEQTRPEHFNDRRRGGKGTLNGNSASFTTEQAHPENSNGGYDEDNAPSESKKGKGKRPKSNTWTDQEHLVLEAIIRDRRAMEAADPNLPRLRDVAFYRHLSATMASNGAPGRSPNACKNYWNRVGRSKSGFEERYNPEGRSLVTSNQSKPPATKRKTSTTKNDTDSSKKRKPKDP